MSPQKIEIMKDNVPQDAKVDEIAERIANQFLNLDNEESFLKEAASNLPESVQEKVVDCIHANIDHIIGFSWYDAAGRVSYVEQLLHLRARFERAMVA